MCSMSSLLCDNGRCEIRTYFAAFTTDGFERVVFLGSGNLKMNVSSVRCLSCVMRPTVIALITSYVNALTVCRVRTSHS